MAPIHATAFELRGLSLSARIRRFGESRLVVVVETGDGELDPALLERGIDLDCSSRGARRAPDRIGERIEEERMLGDVQVRELGPERGLIGLARDECLEGRTQLGVLGRRRPQREAPAAVDELQRAEPTRWDATCRLHQRPREHAGLVSDRRDDAIGDVVLNGVDVGLAGAPVVGLGPELRPAARIDQVRGDTDARRRLPHAAAHHVARVQTLGDLPHVERRVLEAARGLQRDDREAREERESGGDVLGQSRRQGNAVRIGATDRERQYGDPQRVRDGGAAVALPARTRFELLLDVAQLVIDVARRLHAIFRRSSRDSG